MNIKTITISMFIVLFLLVGVSMYGINNSINEREIKKENNPTRMELIEEFIFKYDASIPVIAKIYKDKMTGQEYLYVRENQGLAICPYIRK
jgi:hypothetical protein